MSYVLTGKVVLVTGASSGIGEATALRLAREGAAVVLTARRADRLAALVARIHAGGGEARAVAGDLLSPELRERVVREALAELGGIDALVNNAGYGERGPVELVPLERVRRNFEVNVFALVALTQLVIPHLRQRGGGRIVNVGSVAGRIALPFSAVYAATKHALEALSDGLRRELEPFGIRVVLVQPGFVATEFQEASAEASREVLEDPGPYTWWRKLLARQFDRSRLLAARPDQIAAVVERALTAHRPRARYAAPLHARAALVARRLLPDAAFDAALDALRR
ncbi:MAG: SDR family NAD(P)-dependent oxidoreductase [Gemmatimonadota bacterium]